MTTTQADDGVLRDLGRQLDRFAVAERIGVTVGSLDAYKQRGKLPEPDGHVGRSPWWWATTIDAWVASRPRRGYNPDTHASIHRHTERSK